MGEWFQESSLEIKKGRADHSRNCALIAGNTPRISLRVKQLSPTKRNCPPKSGRIFQTLKEKSPRDNTRST
jgi:hypothetical protein